MKRISQLSHLNKKEKKAVEDFKKLLNKKLKEEVLLIQLFGSKARGNFHRHSDIDILVVLKNDSEKNKDIIYDIVTFLVIKYEIYLSVKVFSKKEFEYLKSIPTIFMQNALGEGIAL